MQKSTKRWLCLAVLLCFIGAVGAFLIQTNFGTVTVYEYSAVTDSGLYTGYLLVPDTATAENPAPAVVLSHGYLNNREMQDSNYVELARRGYVVFVQNAYGHGDSSVASGDSETLVSGGMIDGVEYLATLDFVDVTSIGISGHSMGGGYTDATAAYYTSLAREALENGSTQEEADALNKIASAVIVGNYPLALASVEDTSGESGYWCDLAVIAGQYDEFYLGMSNSYGYELLTSAETQNLIAVQTGVVLSDAAQEGVLYTNTETGYSLALYNPAEFHAQNHFSLASTEYLITFFEETLGAPNPIAASNQIWWLKELFNCIGLVGFFLFIVPFATLLMQLPYFAPLKNAPRLQPSVPVGKAKTAYWAKNLGSGVVNAILILPLLLIGYALLITPFFPQDTTGGIGVWAVGSGLVCLAFARGGKRKGEKAEKTPIAWGMLARSVVLAACVVVGTYSLVFLADAFFQVDFRIWTVVVRVFDASAVLVALRYLPFFLVFYLINSYCISRNDFKEWSEARKIITCVGFNILAPVLFLCVTYLPVLFTQKTIFGGLPGIIGMAGALIPILIIPFVVILGVAAVIAYALYKRTGTFWVGGLVNAMLITMITVANTSYSYPH